jgi:histone H3/H4
MVKEHKDMDNRTVSREEEFERKLHRMERIGLLVLSGVSVLAAVYCHHELRRTVRLVSKACDHVAELTVVDIQHDVVDRAINNAAAHEVGRVVNHAVRCVEDDLARQTQKCVRDAVKESYGKLSKSVSDAIAREVAKVDGNQIMKDATEKAKEMLLERFDGKLDGLMSDYQRNLDNVGKIYQSIASSMADKAGKNVTMTLG